MEPLADIEEFEQVNRVVQAHQSWRNSTSVTVTNKIKTKVLVRLFLHAAPCVRVMRSSDVPSARPGYPRPVRYGQPQRLYAACSQDRTRPFGSGVMVLQTKKKLAVPGRNCSCGDSTRAGECCSAATGSLGDDHHSRSLHLLGHSRFTSPNSTRHVKRIMFTAPGTPSISRL
jgi:hypothetical protein